MRVAAEVVVEPGLRELVGRERQAINQPARRRQQFSAPSKALQVVAALRRLRRDLLRAAVLSALAPLALRPALLLCGEPQQQQEQEELQQHHLRAMHLACARAS